MPAANRTNCTQNCALKGLTRTKMQMTTKKIVIKPLTGSMNSCKMRYAAQMRKFNY